jgi:hypothetical protein
VAGSKVRQALLFFKKEAKNFPRVLRTRRSRRWGFERAKRPGKVFWFFFSKKNILS